MKNKRIILVVLSVVISIAMIVSMGGCFLLSSILDRDNNADNDNNKSNNSVEITVYNDNTPMTFEIEYGEQAEITAFTKSGYYLVGYFSEKSGGTKYFDTEGKSVSMWQETNPTMLYAQWDNIANLQKYIAPTKFYNDPKQVSSVQNTFVSFDLPAEMMNAVKGNLDAYFDVTIQFKSKSRGGTGYGKRNKLSMSICDSKNSGREYFGRNEFYYDSDDYIDFEVNFLVKANAFINGNLYLCLGFQEISLVDSAYIKDIDCTLQYHQPSQDDVIE